MWFARNPARRPRNCGAHPCPASVCAASDATEDAKAGGLDREVYVSMLQELSTMEIRFYIDPKTDDPHIPAIK
jgi:hypothetical protein